MELVFEVPQRKCHQGVDYIHDPSAVLLIQSGNLLTLQDVLE
jgi:hypothetical protein